MLPGFVYRPTGRIDEDLAYHGNRVTDTYRRGEDLPAPAIAMVVQDDDDEGDIDVVAALGLLDRGDVVTTFQRRVLIMEIDWVDAELRYLNNTEFIGLVQRGWIGSRGITSSRIERYISQALRNRHSVTLSTGT